MIMGECFVPCVIGPLNYLTWQGSRGPEKSWFSPIKACNLDHCKKSWFRALKAWKVLKNPRLFLKMSKKISWIVNISGKSGIWSKCIQIMVNWTDLGPKALCCGQKISNEDTLQGFQQVPISLHFNWWSLKVPIFMLLETLT